MSHNLNDAEREILNIIGTNGWFRLNGSGLASYFALPEVRVVVEELVAKGLLSTSIIDTGDDDGEEIEYLMVTPQGVLAVA